LEKDMASRTEISYSDAIVPMVDIDQEVDISWLVGMRMSDSMKISQARQQTKFQMNEKGAKVQSAATICIEKCFRPKEFKICDSFYLCIVRPGMKTPVFAAYIDKDSWKEPKE
jgi:hypothetical protein